MATTEGDCQSVAVPFQIEIFENPEALPVVLDPSCFGENDGNINIGNISGGIAPYEIIFDGNSVDTNSFDNLPAGDYTIQIIDQNQCDWEMVVSVVEPPLSTALIIAPNTVIPNGTSVPITVQVSIDESEIENIFWPSSNGLSCTDCLDPVATPTETTTYTVEITDVSGCVVEARITIQVINDSVVFIPSAFSPNNDGINDIFTVFSAQEIETVNYLRILDRWGNLMFEAENFAPNSQIGWDGTYKGRPMDPAVYLFVTEVQFRDTGVTEVFSGDITLFR